jgi:acetyl esterase/lipase
MNAARSLLLAVPCLLATVARADGPQVVPDVVYGHKDGMALTYDVLQPAKQTGAAILWVQSGGWYSAYTDPKTLTAASKGFLDKGYTVVVIRHGSAPKYTVPEAVADVRRCVRAVRLNAKTHGIDPDRLGVMGMSAGGHLSLMLGTTGDDGNPKAADAILRQSSRVAAVVAICPPTDLRGWTTNPPAEIKKHAGLKPPLTFDAKLEPDVSPLLKVTDRAAPTLLVHGDKDELVPVEHSRNIVPALEKAKVPVKLVEVAGAGHGFTPKQNTEVMAPAIMNWFETHLAEKKN